MSLDRPNPFLSKWAEKGERIDVPNSGADHAKGYADIQTGFPKQTMISVLNGGVPPYGTDHNGILYKLSEANQWTQAGGLPTFNQDFCNAIGGYPVGAILQTSDPSKPWVLWVNLVDGNQANPNLNAINKVGEQNGWMRYPTISSDNGNIQYYDDNGKSIVASPSISTYAYVSSSKGNNDTGLGTRERPYKTPYKAISEMPSAGTCVIYLMAEDIHEFDVIDENGKLLQYIDLASRNIQFIPYSDNPDTQTLQDNAIKHFEDTVINGAYGYCISNLVRPTIRLHWDIFANGIQYFSGLYGTDGVFSVNFYGVHIEIDRVDELSNLTTSMASSWLWNGGNYTFCGSTWGKLPYKANETGFSFIQGWSGAVGNTRVSFLYRNYFSDSVIGNSLFFGIPRDINLHLEDYDVLTPEQMGEYTFIGSNAVPFLSRNSVFNNSIHYVYNPNKSYAGLTSNVPISGVS